VAYAGVLAVGQPAARRIFQRDTRVGGLFGKGTGAVSLQISPSVQVQLLEYQLIDAGSGRVLSSWAPVGPGPFPAASQNIVLQLPANAEWYLLQFRAEQDSTSVVSTSNSIAVGEVIAAGGQSLAADFWGTTESGDATTLASLGIQPSPYTSCLASWDNLLPSGSLPNATTPWYTPSDAGPYSSSFAAEFLSLLVAKTGVAAGLVGYAYTGTYLGQWLPGAVAYNGQQLYSNLTAILTAAGSKYSLFIWCQGHNDARLPGGNGAETPASVYVAQLGTLFGSLANAFPGYTFKRILSSVPSIEAGAASKYSAAWIEIIRGAHLQYIQQDPLAVGHVDGLDVALTSWDNVHPTQAGNITFARHFYRAALQAFGISPFGDHGPSLIGTGFRAQNSNTIVLPVRQAGGTGFAAPAGDLTTQFQVFPSGQVNGSLAVSSVNLSQPGQITITLAASIPNQQALDVWYRYPFDALGAVQDGIYDNNASDGDGLTVGRQLSMLATPMTVGAPVWHRAALVSPGKVMFVANRTAAFVS
jgi:hypothetical protein